MAKRNRLKMIQKKMRVWSHWILFTFIPISIRYSLIPALIWMGMNESTQPKFIVIPLIKCILLFHRLLDFLTPL